MKSVIKRKGGADFLVKVAQVTVMENKEGWCTVNTVQKTFFTGPGVSGVRSMGPGLCTSLRTRLCETLPM